MAQWWTGLNIRLLLWLSSDSSSGRRPTLALTVIRPLPWLSSGLLLWSSSDLFRIRRPDSPLAADWSLPWPPSGPHSCRPPAPALPCRLVFHPLPFTLASSPRQRSVSVIPPHLQYSKWIVIPILPDSPLDYPSFEYFLNRLPSSESSASARPVQIATPSTYPHSGWYPKLSSSSFSL